MAFQPSCPCPFQLVLFASVWPIFPETFPIHIPLRISLKYYYTRLKSSPGCSLHIPTNLCVKMLFLGFL